MLKTTDEGSPCTRRYHGRGMSPILDKVSTPFSESERAFGESCCLPASFLFELWTFPMSRCLASAKEVVPSRIQLPFGLLEHLSIYIIEPRKLCFEAIEFYVPVLLTSLGPVGGVPLLLKFQEAVIYEAVRSQRFAQRETPLLVSDTLAL